MAAPKPKTREKERTAKRRYRERHPEKTRAAAHRYYEAHREQCRAAVKRWQKNNPIRNWEINFACRMRRKYGIEYDEYSALLSEGCAICGGWEQLGVDHCHRTGRVRSALCSVCNLMLGYGGDNPARLLAGVDYLRGHQ